MNKELIGKHIISNCVQVMQTAAEFSVHPKANVQEINGSLRYFSGSQFPYFNGVFNNYQHKSSVIQDDLTEITAYFAEKNVPFIWWWLQETEMPISMKQELDAKGFKFLGDFAGIALELNQNNTANKLTNDKAITIKLVENIEEYQKAITLLCDVFQLTTDIKKDMENMFQSYGPNGKFKHYLGFYHEEVVAMVSSYIQGNVVGLYNGATLPSARNKGFCSILIKKAIDDAMLLGCQYGVAQLMASAMAKSLTEKLGFKKYCSLLPFLKEPNLV